MADNFLVVDFRKEWLTPSRHPFITFWRPDDAGYCYDVTSAGRYLSGDLKSDYHDCFVYGSTTRLERFAVAEQSVLEVAHAVPANIIGRWQMKLIVMNNGPMRQFLRKHRFALKAKL
jgi:hypothetical protein